MNKTFRFSVYAEKESEAVEQLHMLHVQQKKFHAVWRKDRLLVTITNPTEFETLHTRMLYGGSLV